MEIDFVADVEQGLSSEDLARLARSAGLAYEQRVARLAQGTHFPGAPEDGAYDQTQPQRHEGIPGLRADAA
jgi:hypothetical protein